MSSGTSTAPVSVSVIKDKLLRPALTSHYICNFVVPGGSNGFIGSRVGTGIKLYDRLSLACFDASLPGSTLATHDINNDFTGVSEKHVYRRLYDDRADFSFYVDAEEYYAIKFFESWMSFAVNEQNRNINKRWYTYRVNYPDSYCSDGMSITKFERSQGSATLVYKFIKAFPISINSIPISYESSELLKCTVSFAYSRYYIDGTTGFNSSPTSTSAPSTPTTPTRPEPGQTTGTGVPRVPFDITPQDQANFNSRGFDLFSNQSPNLFNVSPGTAFDSRAPQQQGGRVPRPWSSSNLNRATPLF